jgi:long-chain acyl-CoA synthetase
MNLVQLLHASARRLPNAAALAVGRTMTATYGELAERTSRLAAGILHRHGLRQGDRVAMVMKNCPDYFEVLFACWHAGLVAVPINAKLHAREIAYIIENSGAKLCFVTPELEESVTQGVSIGSPDFARLASARRSCLAVLHQWNNRCTKRGDAHAPQPAFPHPGLSFGY